MTPFWFLRRFSFEFAQFAIPKMSDFKTQIVQRFYSSGGQLYEVSSMTLVSHIQAFTILIRPYL